MYEAAEEAEALLILTEWDDFKNADLKKVKGKMLVPKIVDGRNIYDPKNVREMGFEYISMGRP
jgi:UDPglucose 6-dehydrogenase